MANRLVSINTHALGQTAHLWMAPILAQASMEAASRGETGM